MIVTNFPRPLREIEHTFIPLRDGTKLAARIWLPEDAVRNPVPAILEYLPYRKRAGTYDRDALTHPYLAGHGYAAVRVDIRGSGESDGLLFDEYAQQEQVAARRPPALKAIITICSTDDRYRDDVHYMGGALLRANFGWALFGAMCHP